MEEVLVLRGIVIHKLPGGQVGRQQNNVVTKQHKMIHAGEIPRSESRHTWLDFQRCPHILRTKLQRYIIAMYSPNAIEGGGWDDCSLATLSVRGNNAGPPALGIWCQGEGGVRVLNSLPAWLKNASLLCTVMEDHREDHQELRRAFSLNIREHSSQRCWP